MYKAISSILLLMLCGLYCFMCWYEKTLIEVSNQFLGIVVALAGGNIPGTVPDKFIPNRFKDEKNVQVPKNTNS